LLCDAVIFIPHHNEAYSDTQDTGVDMPQGIVKWFNNAKGYGFIIEDGESEDLFAHFSSIQMEGYKTLKAGQAVQFEKQPGDKGFHAVSIMAAEQTIPEAHSVDHDEFISVEETAPNHQMEEQPTSSLPDESISSNTQSTKKTASA